ncbi:hypothetical protein [Rhodococcus sp. H29-C3]|uniref:hypothetical protein n=1 Tax=Rhodococcus sp. H29-C3 TaxID=3046307 RepID=UPI0024BA3AA8|nr:hypothetical protein [Rhodococcus sp. H29-C3]MDJ0362825.1 hypothetical protein [Rhodococcus sp. H29-C3]
MPACPRIEARVAAAISEWRREGDIAAGSTGMSAVMAAAAGACPRPDQHGSWAEGMTASAPQWCILGPSIARSMERS